MSGLSHLRPGRSTTKAGNAHETVGSERQYTRRDCCFLGFIATELETGFIHRPREQRHFIWVEAAGRVTAAARIGLAAALSFGLSD
jgi:hypothetical protein